MSAGCRQSYPRAEPEEGYVLLPCEFDPARVGSEIKGLRKKERASTGLGATTVSFRMHMMIGV